MNLVIEILAELCECMAFVICINTFLNRKLAMNVKMVIFSITEIIMVIVIIEMRLATEFSLIGILLLFIYIWWEFKQNWKRSIILTMLSLVLISCIQLLVVLPISFIHCSDEMSALMINGILLIIINSLKKWKKLNALYLAVINKEVIILQILLLVGLLITYLIIRYKVNEKIYTMLYFISAIMAISLIIIVLNWQKDRYIMKQKTMELKLHELYGNTFEGMIDNIRIRQHNFKNQLAAIYGMHLTTDNFGELVESQKKYCDYLMKESRFDKILTRCNDKILAGFLYTKFTEVECKGVDIQFEVSVCGSKHTIETYELIEIIGVLVDNAMEYETEKKTGKPIFISVSDEQERMKIICRNKVYDITTEEMAKFFNKGFSTKGEKRGLGLYNVKKILESKGDIIVSNEKIENENWFEICIVIE